LKVDLADVLRRLRLRPQKLSAADSHALSVSRTPKPHTQPVSVWLAATPKRLQIPGAMIYVQHLDVVFNSWVENKVVLEI
jgi:hypothetical protein